jgi:hypothetical protein
MGLDQYLKASKYVSAYDYTYNDDGEMSRHKTDEFNQLSKMMDISVGENDQWTFATVEFCIGYWRKANAIHQWFVDNVQDGDDDCGKHYVSREKLVELMVVCKRVLGNRALGSEHLPTQDGFFFGETEYDEWYFQSLEDTVTFIDKALSLDTEWGFEYSSSW